MASCRTGANSLVTVGLVIFCLLIPAAVRSDSTPPIIISKTIIQHLDVYSGLISITLPEKCEPKMSSLFDAYTNCVINAYNNDGTVASICDRSIPGLEKCSDSFVQYVQSDECVPDKMKDNFAIVKSAVVRGDEYLCLNNGKNLKEFGGVNCLDSALDSKCYQDIVSRLQVSLINSVIMSNTTLDFAREYDSYLKGMRSCVPDQCRDAKLTSTFESYFESMRTQG